MLGPSEVALSISRYILCKFGLCSRGAHVLLHTCYPAEGRPLTAAAATADADRSPCMGLALPNAAVALLDCAHTALAKTTEASAANSTYEVLILTTGLIEDWRPFRRCLFARVRVQLQGSCLRVLEEVLRASR